LRGLARGRSAVGGERAEGRHASDRVSDPGFSRVSPGRCPRFFSFPYGLAKHAGGELGEVTVLFFGVGFRAPACAPFPRAREPRCSAERSALHTLIHQRRLAPSCGGHAPTAERTLDPARMIKRELDPWPGIREQPGSRTAFASFSRLVRIAADSGLCRQGRRQSGRWGKIVQSCPRREMHHRGGFLSVPTFLGAGGKVRAAESARGRSPHRCGSSPIADAIGAESGSWNPSNTEVSKYRCFDSPDRNRPMRK
jgi:hypothetical protein